MGVVQEGWEVGLRQLRLSGQDLHLCRRLVSHTDVVYWYAILKILFGLAEISNGFEGHLEHSGVEHQAIAHISSHSTSR